MARDIRKRSATTTRRTPARSRNRNRRRSAGSLHQVVSPGPLSLQVPPRWHPEYLPLASWACLRSSRTTGRQSVPWRLAVCQDEIRRRRWRASAAIAPTPPWGGKVVIRFIIGQESGTRGYRDRQCTALMFPMLSQSFTVVEFTTPAEGLASPVFRNNAGFVGGGRTAGGVREFVLPNGPLPAGATVRRVGP